MAKMPRKVSSLVCAVPAALKFLRPGAPGAVPQHYEAGRRARQRQYLVSLDEPRAAAIVRLTPAFRIRGQRKVVVPKDWFMELQLWMEDEAEEDLEAPT